MGDFALELLEPNDPDYLGKHNRNSDKIRETLGDYFSTYQSMTEQNVPGGYAMLDRRGGVSIAHVPGSPEQLIQWGERNRSVVTSAGTACGWVQTKSNGAIPYSAIPIAIGLAPYAVINNVPKYLYFDDSWWLFKRMKGLAGGHCPLDEKAQVPIERISRQTVVYADQADQVGGYPRIDPDTLKIKAEYVSGLREGSEFQPLAEKGQPNGYASLDNGKHVPTSQLDIAALRAALGL